jgi:hypothetical protein
MSNGEKTLLLEELSCRSIRQPHHLRASYAASKNSKGQQKVREVILHRAVNRSHSSYLDLGKVRYLFHFSAVKREIQRTTLTFLPGTNVISAWHEGCSRMRRAPEKFRMVMITTHAA